MRGKSQIGKLESKIHAPIPAKNKKPSETSKSSTSKEMIETFFATTVRYCVQNLLLWRKTILCELEAMAEIWSVMDFSSDRTSAALVSMLTTSSASDSTSRRIDLRLQVSTMCFKPTRITFTSKILMDDFLVIFSLKQTKDPSESGTTQPTPPCSNFSFHAASEFIFQLSKYHFSQCTLGLLPF